MAELEQRLEDRLANVERILLLLNSAITKQQIIPKNEGIQSDSKIKTKKLTNTSLLNGIKSFENSTRNSSSDVLPNKRIWSTVDDEKFKKKAALAKVRINLIKFIFHLRRITHLIQIKTPAVLFKILMIDFQIKLRLMNRTV